MTITQLKYVLAVAEYKNFTKAAKKVFVTQPTLSMQIQKLEDELDVKIFDRTKKPIELTEVGVTLVQQAKNIVYESERMQDVIDQQKGYIGGSFTLGIIPTVTSTLLPMFLNTFINEHSKVKLKIVEMTTKDMVYQLLEGTIDAGIAATPLNHSEINEKPLYYEPFIGYVPSHHYLNIKKKLKPSDLNLESLLLLEDGHCFRDNILNICKNNTETTGEGFKLVSGSIETMLKLANEGLGMTLLPYLHSLDVKEEYKKYLKKFETPSPAREVSIIYNTNKLKIQIIDALHTTISNIVRGAIAFEDVKIIAPILSK